MPRARILSRSASTTMNHLPALSSAGSQDPLLHLFSRQLQLERFCGFSCPGPGMMRFPREENHWHGITSYLPLVTYESHKNHTKLWMEYTEHSVFILQSDFIGSKN